MLPAAWETNPQQVGVSLNPAIQMLIFSHFCGNSMVEKIVSDGVAISWLQTTSKNVNGS